MDMQDDAALYSFEYALEDIKDRAGDTVGLKIVRTDTKRSWLGLLRQRRVKLASVVLNFGDDEYEDLRPYMASDLGRVVSEALTKTLEQIKHAKGIEDDASDTD